ncbi:MAG: DUF3618 domain-containing protein [Geminicoccaceae bacterium]|nr:DUF3618 domain-containing protein [Geminicoccaceae bacterium]
MTTDQRTPEEIERDLASTRARMDRTLTDLEQKLSPGQLVDQTMAYLREGGYGENVKAFGTNLSRQMRDNPLPVALVGIGLTWLAMGQRQSRNGAYGPDYDRPDYDRLGVARSAYSPGVYDPDTGTYGASDGAPVNLQVRARSAADDVKRRTDETLEAFEHRRQQAMARILDVREQAGETASAFKARVDEAMENAGRTFREWQADMQRRGHEASAYARDRWDRSSAYARESWEHSSRRARELSETAADLFQQQPLLGAAAGITIGALLGSLLPPTEREDELMGRYRDDALERGRREAERAAQEAADVASRAGEKAYEAARDEAERSTRGTGPA